MPHDHKKFHFFYKAGNQEKSFRGNFSFLKMQTYVLHFAVVVAPTDTVPMWAQCVKFHLFPSTPPHRLSVEYRAGAVIEIQHVKRRTGC